GIVLLLERESLLIRAERTRGQDQFPGHPFSRTVVNRALQEGVGLLSEDIRSDQRFRSSATVTALNLRSVLCVPLICPDGRRLGVVQLDSFQQGQMFSAEDLQLVTAVGL